MRWIRKNDGHFGYLAFQSRTVHMGHISRLMYNNGDNQYKASVLLPGREFQVTFNGSEEACKKVVEDAVGRWLKAAKLVEIADINLGGGS